MMPVLLRCFYVHRQQYKAPLQKPMPPPFLVGMLRPIPNALQPHDQIGQGPPRHMRPRRHVHAQVVKTRPNRCEKKLVVQKAQVLRELLKPSPDQRLLHSSHTLLCSQSTVVETAQFCEPLCSVASR